jgi:(1->4)-alpha-D-glucan 1-alpha-D-glucosylmutase
MPPPIPTATYRIQLTAAFGFDAAAALVPYLKSLGISHLYASPFLKSRAGSPHGYDVVDHTSIDPELGGEEGLRRLCEALVKQDMGLILDFVPNHMGVHHADNHWWLDVLEWGPKSPYASFFDIEWQSLPKHPRGGVLLPILGKPYGEALDKGEIVLRYDAQHGTFSAWYHEHQLPIGPNRYSEIIEKVIATAGASEEAPGRALLELAQRYRGAHNPQREKAPELKSALAAIAGAKDVIERGLRAFDPNAGEPGALMALHHLLERQHYRVAYWPLAGSEINYRRFFDINDLAGLRVEDKAVFEAIHAKVRQLIARGWLSGLRIDHIDGLRDPHQYCRRLQRLAEVAKPPGSAPFYVVVEKILAEGERLPRFAGVCGTTGYEWLNTISRVLLDDKGSPELDEAWREASGEHRSFDAIVLEARRRVIANILASEFTVLARLLARIAAGHYSTRDYAAERLRAAFELFILHFPVYRTYITPSGPSREDRATIDQTIARARAEWFGPDIRIFDFLRDALTLDLISRDRSGYSIARDRQFALKVQQFTGPMMAKSLEDTAFYRYHRCLALNEVGGNPAAGALPLAEFHKRMQERAAKASLGLTATATHDTKRGEDARTRLLALSELAGEWREKVREWREDNAALISHTGIERIPTRAHEYMIYQALLGAWPLTNPDASFVARMQFYVVKAAREGKQVTSWLAPDESYEAGLTQFVERMLDRGRSGRFLASFEGFVRRTALLGALNSLTQTALKIFMPGIPDFYQGTEFWDLSLVDPDNRRTVDFAARASTLTSLTARPDWNVLAAEWQTGRIKLALTHCLLDVRRQFRELLKHGDYRPLQVTGPDCEKIIAFARRSGRAAVLLIAGRLFHRVTNGGRHWLSAGSWNANVKVEEIFGLRNLLLEDANVTQRSLPVSGLFGPLPIAVLHGECARTRLARPTARPALVTGAA